MAGVCCICRAAGPLTCLREQQRCSLAQCPSSEVMALGTGQSWGPHEEEGCINSFCSFSTLLLPRELSALPVHTGVIAAVCVQAGASLLVKRVCGTDTPGTCLCQGFECVLSAEAPGWQHTLITLLSVLCLEAPCALTNLCAGGRESVGQGELLCSTKIFTCLRNFALGINDSHAAFSLTSCCQNTSMEEQLVMFLLLHISITALLIFLSPPSLSNTAPSASQAAPLALPDFGGQVASSKR